MTEFSQVSTLPRELGPYRLERLLGRGGMGVVYVAYDQRLERQVAIKRVLTGAAARRGWQIAPVKTGRMQEVKVLYNERSSDPGWPRVMRSVS